MRFEECIREKNSILMEGALGERLKREYRLRFDEQVAMAKLVYQAKGRRALDTIWNGYVDIAQRYAMPFIATTPTRRANRERVEAACAPKTIIRDNVALLRDVQRKRNVPMYIGGLMGCRGDAYTGKGNLREEEACTFHSWQAEQFAQAQVDFLFAGIMPTLPEAAGIARAMGQTGIPYIISFTIQRDGKLIDGTTVTEAIQYIDGATKVPPVCYMANCVHPSIVREALLQPFNQNELTRERFLGIQGNTSPLSYAELDIAVDLQESMPEDFAREMMKLRESHPIKIFGGCCGTDQRHMECVAQRLQQGV